MDWTLEAVLVSVHFPGVVILDFAEVWKKATIAPFLIIDQSGPEIIVAGIATNPPALNPTFSREMVGIREDK